MSMRLLDYQRDAVSKMKNGSILCGGTGSGKSITALAYFFFQNGGIYSDGTFIPMPDPPLDLYIITTAAKRDRLEWDDELARFLLSTNPSVSSYSNKVVVDSWNNIGKYSKVEGSFFIFDEQRVGGNGKWAKTFIKIAKSNRWILLSATPGDTWADYASVFIANGFFKNVTEYKREHFIQVNYAGYPQTIGYNGEQKLNRLRRQILIPMIYEKHTTRFDEDIYVKYDKYAYKNLIRTRMVEGRKDPIVRASELCFEMQKIVFSDKERAEVVRRLARDHDRLIVFYNYDFELDILREIKYDNDVVVAEYNGHRHDPIPHSVRWVYYVNYKAGAEGWNCTATDAMVFFSQTYSYKTLEQAKGRIDRMNTKYERLYYYHIKSHAPIDIAIERALKKKEIFNEREFARQI